MMNREVWGTMWDKHNIPEFGVMKKNGVTYAFISRSEYLTDMEAVAKANTVSAEDIDKARAEAHAEGHQKAVADMTVREAQIRRDAHRSGYAEGRVSTALDSDKIRQDAYTSGFNTAMRQKVKDGKILVVTQTVLPTAPVGVLTPEIKSALNKFATAVEERFGVEVSPNGEVYRRYVAVAKAQEELSTVLL